MTERERRKGSGQVSDRWSWREGCLKWKVLGKVFNVFVLITTNTNVFYGKMEGGGQQTREDLRFARTSEFQDSRARALTGRRGRGASFSVAHLTSLSCRS